MMPKLKFQIYLTNFSHINLSILKYEFGRAIVIRGTVGYWDAVVYSPFITGKQQSNVNRKEVFFSLRIHCTCMWSHPSQTKIY